jgi:hypothetical protein
MLHPQVVALLPDSRIVWLGNDEQAWKLWFESYTKFITHYAALAENISADYFAIGNEMYEASAREADWRAVVSAVRKVYHGRITYAAHIFDVFTLTWWDAVDVIGVNAYFPISDKDDPTLAELKSGWLPHVTKLENLSEKWNKPILFTELTYASLRGASYWGGWMPPLCVHPQLDLQVQADLYQALLDTFTGKPWWLGIFWWAWSADPAEGGPYDGTGSPLGKPAEDVLRYYYSGSPRLTATLLPILIGDSNQELVLYDGTLNPDWFVYQNGASIDLNYQGETYQGRPVIEISLDGSYYEFDTYVEIDLSPYNWIEFYVKFVNADNPALTLRFGHWTPAFHETTHIGLGALPSEYVTPSHDGWEHVLVPLSKVYPDEAIQPGRIINELGFIFGMDGCAGNGFTPPFGQALLANIRFVSSITTQP